jgi:hypothetical protein
MLPVCIPGMLGGTTNAGVAGQPGARDSTAGPRHDGRGYKFQIPIMTW